MDFVTDAKAIEYLKSFKKRKRVDFKEIYPGSTNDAIDLLTKTITFNPKQRLSLDEALAHPVFDAVRKKELEIFDDVKPITIDFENEGYLDTKRLRELFI